MGANSSKDDIPLRESEADLHWVLQENAQWSERSNLAVELLDAPMMEPLDGKTSTLEQRSTHMFREIDSILADGFGSTHSNTPNILNKINSSSALSIATSSSSTSSSIPSDGNGTPISNAGAGSNTDIFDMDKPIRLPLSHPAHQFQASQFFGVAATQEVLIMNKNFQTPTSGNANKGQQLSEWTRQGLNRASAQAALGRNTVQGIGASENIDGVSSTSVSSIDGDSSLGERRFSTGSQNELEIHQPIVAPSSSLQTQQVGSNYESAPGRTLVVDGVNVPSSGLATGTGTGLGVGGGSVGVGLSSSLASSSSPTSLPSRTSGLATSPIVGSSIGVGVGSITAGGTSSSISSSRIFSSEERVELSTKFLYIQGLLDKMVSAGQLSYQLARQSEVLRKRLKPKRTKKLSQLEIDEMKQQFEEKKRVTKAQRELFNKSRLTLQWFYRDFHFNHGLVMLHDLEVLTRSERTRFVQRMSMAQSMGTSSTGSTTPSSSSSSSDGQVNLSTFDDLLGQIEHRRIALDLSLMSNERYALSIAHYYLSKHSPGEGLTLQDASDLKLEYFHLLDTTRTSNVSREQLQMSLIRLSETIDSIHVRLWALQMHTAQMSTAGVTFAVGSQNTNVFQANTNKIDAMQTELNETRRALDEINGYFLHTFTRNIFVGVEQADLQTQPVQAASIDASGLRSDLGQLTISKKAVNPLDLSNAGVIGPNEIVQNADVGAGGPIEHRAGLSTPRPEVIIDSMDDVGDRASDDRAALETGLLVGGGSGLAAASLLTKSNPSISPRQGPMPSLKELNIRAHESDANRNASLAGKFGPLELGTRRSSLRHVDEKELRTTMFGGLHDIRRFRSSSSEESDTSASKEIPLAQLIRTTAWKAPVLAHQLQPIDTEEIEPSPYGGYHDGSNWKSESGNEQLPSSMIDESEKGGSTILGEGIQARRPSTIAPSLFQTSSTMMTTEPSLNNDVIVDAPSSITQPQTGLEFDKKLDSTIASNTGIGTNLGLSGGGTGIGSISRASSPLQTDTIPIVTSALPTKVDVPLQMEQRTGFASGLNPEWNKLSVTGGGIGGGVDGVSPSSSSLTSKETNLRFDPARANEQNTTITQ